ncbi:MAG: DUF4340 domain-containing protein [Parvularculales bacterium]
MKAIVRLTLLLLVLTVIVTLGAWWALNERGQFLNTEQGSTDLLLPGFSENLSLASKVTLTFGQGIRGTRNITLKADEAGTWRVEERLGYPADGGLVQHLLLGLARTKIIAPRTADPERHKALGLGAPEDFGTGARVRIDGEGQIDGQTDTLASVLVGNVQTNSGGARRYMRRTGENQSYLVTSTLPVVSKVVDWLDPAFVALPPERVETIVIADSEGTQYRLVREKISGDYNLDYSGEEQPTTRRTLLNEPARIISRLRFDDVLPSEAINFETAWQAVFYTDDGLIVTLTMTGAGNAVWTTLSAQASPDAPDSVRDEAHTINNRLSKWAYKLPFEQAAVLTQPLSALIVSPSPAS